MSHPFKTAVESWDFDAIPALLAEDVVFRSPVAFKPYHGRAMVGAILLGVSRVFEDFRYEREVGGEGPGVHVLEFKARVGDVDVHGVDILTTGDDGLITELTVMVRPLSAANAVAAAMKVQFAAIMESPPG
ncbi:hypothetical protein DSM112329_03607 [Paraconexibacter sp. AEG42_29]|uniref:SnoaL-like domain-containing protein n=1 Tax=Paraconexibacter sp. AEG42_29 TaxID=2997339 RepID=A0AAU7AYA9_9ACTN